MHTFSSQAHLHIVCGYVVNNVDPDKLGRVQVSFHQPDNQQALTQWARLALPYASKSGGMHFIPNCGDEVAIAFVNGDLNQPVVMGALYNEEQRPPELEHSSNHNQDQKNSLRLIQSGTGQQLVFSDKADENYLQIYDGESMRLRLDRTEKKATLSDQQGNCVEIDSNQKSLEIKDAQGNRVWIKDGKIEIEAKQRISLGAGAEHAVPLGDLLMQLFNSHTHNTGVGPSSPPIQPMSGQHLSKLSYTR